MIFSPLFPGLRKFIALLGIVSSFCVGIAQEPFVTTHLQTPEVLSRSTDLGPLDQSRQIHVSIALTPGAPTGLQTFADNVSDPKSPMYRHFITPDEVGKRFGLPQAQLDRVVQYLKNSGFKVRLVAKNRLGILAQCSVSQAQAAFHISIHQFESHDLADADHPGFYSPTTAPELPQSIAPLILAINGLENHTRPRPRLKRLKQAGTAGPFTPAQASILYNLSPLEALGNHGQGRTIAISNFDGFSLTSASDFETAYSLPAPTSGYGSNITEIEVDGVADSTLTPGAEGDIDLQMVLSQAPLSNIRIYDGWLGGNESDPYGILIAELDDNLADVISESYGWGLSSDYASEMHTAHLSMTAQGITYCVAAGDSGANDQTYDYPDYEPEVSLIGGTVAQIGSNGARSSETTWGWVYRHAEVGGGGGWMTNSATFNTTPSWQSGITSLVPGSNVPNARFFPDISLEAGGANSGSDQGAFYFYFSPSVGGTPALTLGYDGTSFASPFFAGSLGVVEEYLISQNALNPNSTGKYRLGRINDFVYSLNGKASVFYDVTTGSNGTLPNGSASSAGVGWDTATGWGAPNFQGLATSLLPVTPALTSLSVTNVTGGSNATGTVTLASAASGSGVSVSLSSGPAYVSVPTTVTVPSGLASVTFPVTTRPYSTTYMGTVTATLQGVHKSGTFSVYGDSLAGFVINPSTIPGGTSATGTITLNNPAPITGWSVKIINNKGGLVSTPSTVTVPSGLTSANFIVGTVNYPANYSVNVNVADLTTNFTQTLNTTYTAPGIAFAPASVLGSGSTTGTVTLGIPAPSGGEVVPLASSIPSYVSVPASVTVAAGQMTATFPVTVKPYPQTYSCPCAATIYGVTYNAAVTVLGDSVSSVSLSPSGVVGGGSSTGTVNLGTAAPAGGWTVNLASSLSSYVSVPATVIVPAGLSSTTFAVTTKPYSVSYSAQITASDLTSTKFTNINVSSLAVLSMSFNPSSVVGGTNSTGTVTLTGTAPVGGTVVTLASSIPGYVGIPATVTVPAGKNSVTFTATTKSYSSTYSCPCSASCGGNTVNAALTVTNG